jgi:hypothetical protein
MAYALTLTETDFDAILFVGDCYCWSAALMRLTEPGNNDIAEPDAWSLREAFDADTEGGHAPFPMLDDRSELAGKLFSFWDSIV